MAEKCERGGSFRETSEVEAKVRMPEDVAQDRRKGEKTKTETKKRIGIRLNCVENL